MKSIVGKLGLLHIANSFSSLLSIFFFFCYEHFVVYLSAEARVEADPKNKKAAGIMLLSLVPFLMVTLSAICDSHSWSRIIVLITLIISSSSTVVYFVYSVYMIPFENPSKIYFGFSFLSY